MTAPTTHMSSSASAQLSVALDRIRVTENVRELDAAHVNAIAASIALQGVIVPLVVRPRATGDDSHSEDFELVAGSTATPRRASLSSPTSQSWSVTVRARMPIAQWKISRARRWTRARRPGRCRRCWRAA